MTNSDTPTLKAQRENLKFFQGCDFSTPVVILKCVEDSYIGLGIIRSLGRLGVPIYSVISDSEVPSRFSRYTKVLCFQDLHAETPDEKLLDYMMKVARIIGRRPVVIPTMDFYAKFLSKYRDALEEYFLFPKCSLELVKALCSKYEMYNIAIKHCIPVPKSAFPKSIQDVDEFLGEAKFPIIVKAVDWTDLTFRPRTKSVLLNSRQELISRCHITGCTDFPNLVLQEYIDGERTQDWMFNGYFDRQSICRISFTGKKLRQAPVDVGYTSLGECMENQFLRDVSTEFLGNIGYCGIVDIDYRYDPRDGFYKILDVNPRVGATFRLFVGRRGLDVVRAMYLDLTNQEIPNDTQINGRKWVVEDSDLRSAYQCFRRGTITMSEYFHSLCGIKEGAWFAVDDPLPFLARVRHHCRI